MKKFIKALFVSAILLFSNNINPTPNYELSEELKVLITTPKEIIHLGMYQGLDITNLKELNNIPVYSPIAMIDFKRISSPYGNRIHPIKRIKSFHTGIDIAANKYIAVRATANGVITNAKRRGGYGKMIEINHYNEYSSRYAHLSIMYSSLGDTVHVGDTIGLVGSTGLSTGPHLHYEIRKNNIPINPLAIYPTEITEKNYKDYFNVINKTIDYSDNV